VNASGFIEVVASGIPRLDYYTSGGTAGCPALLVEPSGSNLVPNGVGFTSSTGVQTSGITDSPAVAISGTVVTKNEASGTIRYLGQNFSASALASGTTYTVSRFFKYNGVAFNTSIEHNNAAQWGGVGWIQAVVLSAASGVTLGASTACTGSIENFGNGWHRVNVRVTTGAAISGAATVAVLSILPAALSTGQGFLTACPQLEVGSVATSYIPTTTAAVTRNAEVINLSGAVSGCIGQTQGTIYAEVDVRNITDSKAIIQSDDGTSDNRLVLFIGTSPIRIQFLINAAGANSFVSGIIDTGINKIAVSYSSGSVQLYLNGSFLASGTPTTFPTVTRNNLSLGGRILLGVYGAQFNDRIRAVALYNSRLTNETLAFMTSPYTTYQQMASQLNYTSL
jgi:hypothetical protein